MKIIANYRPKISGMIHYSSNNKKTIIISTTAILIAITMIAVLLLRHERSVTSPLAPTSETSPLASEYNDISLFLSAIKQTTAKADMARITGLIVPHHLLAKDLMASAYARAAGNRYSTIVILSPDHFSAGKKNISTTERDFSTVFGTVSNNKEIYAALAALPFVSSGDFLYREHGLETQLPFIKYYFPEATVVPIVFKPETTADQLDQIAAILEKSLPPDSLIVESTDFSHYLTPAAAALNDQKSWQTITSENNAFTLNQPDNIDSKAALYLEMKLQKDFYQAKPQLLFHKNSQDYTKDSVASSTSYLVVAYQTPDLTESPKDIELIFTGDIMLSRHIGEIMAQKNDYFFPFEKITPTLQNADFVFGNLETPVSDGGQDTGHLYSFRSDPRALYGLTAAGYKGVSIANNHIFDYGNEAFADTLKNLSAAGISYSGGGYNFNEAHAGAFFEVSGTKIIILSYTDLLPSQQAAAAKTAGYAYLDQTQMTKDIKQAKKKADLVIVSCHWGQEYKTKSNEHQQQIAATAVKAGADLIIGHHPHVAEEVTTINNAPVAYSLGNFVFDQNFSPETATGLILKVKIQDKKIATTTPIIIHFNKSFQPYLVDEK